jgi:branched-chain amino acid transport system permease protein
VTPLALTFDFLTNVEFWVGVAVSAAAYGIFALGLQLNIGTTGILNFGQVGFMAVGAYTMAIFVLETGMNLWLAMLVGLPVAVAAGVGIGLVALRLRSDYFAIATLAFAEIVRYVVNYWEELTGGSLGLFGYSTAWQEQSTKISERLASVGLEEHYLLPLAIVGWAVFVVCAVAVWGITRTPWGRVLRAIREDEDAARALGKNTFLCKLQSLGIAAALGALAGYVLALDLAILSPESFDSTFTIFGVTIIVLGGLGSYLGVALGAAVLITILEGTRFIGIPLADDKVAGVRFIVVGVILILLVAFRPQGLLGSREQVVKG